MNRSGARRKLELLFRESERGATRRKSGKRRRWKKEEEEEGEGCTLGTIPNHTLILGNP